MPVAHVPPRVIMFPYWLLFFIFALGALVDALRRSSSRALAGQAASVGQPIRGLDPLLSGAALVAAFMIGFRYQVGGDWYAYESIFERIGSLSFWKALWYTDPGYAFLNWAANAVGVEIWGANLVCGLLFTFGLTRFARTQPYPWLVYVVAVPYLVIGVGMGYSRQAVAIGLSLAGMAALSRGSFTRFLFWIFAAALFHRTVLVLIPIIGISYSRNRLQTLSLTIVAVVLASVLLQESAEGFKRAYVTRAYESQGAGIRLAMNIVPAIIFLGWSRRFEVGLAERMTWRNLSIVALSSFALWMVVETTVAVDRLALYIIPLQLFVFSRVPVVFSRNGGPTPAIVLLVILYSALVQFVWLFYANHSKFWIPYQLYPVG